VRGNLRELYFLACLLTPFYGEKKMENKRFTGVRLNENDRELLEAIAKRYDISISDVVRIAIKEYIKSNGIKLKEGP
jgi:replication initiation and membrane attachment protein DnaB